MEFKAEIEMKLILISIRTESSLKYIRKLSRIMKNLTFQLWFTNQIKNDNINILESAIETINTNLAALSKGLQKACGRRGK